MSSNSTTRFDADQLKALTDRLDAVIRFLALTLPKDFNQTKKIQILSSVGLMPTEIAAILGTSSNTVRVTLSELRKSIKTAQTESPAKETSTDVNAKLEISSEDTLQSTPLTHH